MIVRNGIAESHIMYNFFVYNDENDEVFIDDNFETLDEIVAYASDTKIHIEGDYTCEIHVGKEEMDGSFLSSSFIYHELNTCLDSTEIMSLIDLTEEVCSGGLIASQDYRPYLQDVYDFRSEALKKYRNHKLITVCSECLNPLDSCTCGKADAGKLTVAKDILQIIKALDGTKIGDEDFETWKYNGFVMEGITKNNSGNCEMDFFESDEYRGSELYEIYNEIPEAEEFYGTAYEIISEDWYLFEHEGIEMPDCFSFNDDSLGMIIKFEGNTKEEYDKDRTRKLEQAITWTEGVKKRSDGLLSDGKADMIEDEIHSGNKYIYVCPKCFEPREKCVCDESGSMIEIDSNIFPIVKRLNRSGYYTKFCCEGHNSEEKAGSGYIYFDRCYQIKPLPDFCKFEVNGLMTFAYEGDSLSAREQDKEKKLAYLLNWAQTEI